AGECDRDRRDPRPGRERGCLDEGRRGRLGGGRAGEEDSQDGYHGKARTEVGRGQKFHGNLLLYKGENENELKRWVDFEWRHLGRVDRREAAGRVGKQS